MSRPEAFVTLDRYKHDLANLNYQRKYALERVVEIIDNFNSPKILEKLLHLKWSLEVPADQLLFAPFPDNVKSEVR